MERLECAANVAANAGNSAQVLVDHCQRFSVPDRLRRDPGLSVHRLGEIEISAGLMNNGNDVKGLGDC